MQRILPVLLLLGSIATAFSQDLGITVVDVPSSVPLYGLFEATFNLSTSYNESGRFDPAVIDVNGLMVLPDGTKESFPAFYKQDGYPCWAARYSPRQSGDFTFQITAQDFTEGSNSSETYKFTVSAQPASAGFLQVTQNSPLFSTSNGDAFVIDGYNMPICGTPSGGYDAECEVAMPYLNSLNMNFIRMWANERWMAHAIERGSWSTWQEGGIPITWDGIGKYNLDNAARADNIFANAMNSSVYIQWTLNSFSDYGGYGTPSSPGTDTGTNAYMSTNGGPLQQTTDVWTNEEGMAYFKRYMRYNFARWGAFPSFGLLELWNEFDQDCVYIYTQDPYNWHQTMNEYWKSLDIYNHPTTTSFAWMDMMSQNRPVWTQLSFLDVTNEHRYQTEDTADFWPAEIRYLHNSTSNMRPAYIAEYGMTGNDPTSSDPQGYFYHDGAWVSFFFAQAAGTNMPWSIDGTSVPHGITSQPYAAFGAFLKEELSNLPSLGFFTDATNTEGVEVGGYASQYRVIAMIRNTQQLPNNNSPGQTSGVVVTLNNLASASFTVELWDTMTGQVVQTTSNNAPSGGVLKVSVPAFTRAIAMKAYAPNPSTTSGTTSATYTTAPASTITSTSTSTSSSTTTSGSTTGSTSAATVTTTSTSATTAITTGPIVPVYQGCYEDPDNNRTVNSDPVNITNMTPQDCLQHCVLAQYSLSAIYAGLTCFCGNTYPAMKVGDSDCWRTCPGNQNYICGGGAWRVSIYTMLNPSILVQGGHGQV